MLTYYNSRMLVTPGKGLTGLSPSAVSGYFRNLGYSVTMTDAPDLIDIFSKTADASIMYYMYPTTYNILGFAEVNAYGAHFVEYHKAGSGYIGVNTSAANGISRFQTPSDYMSQNKRFYAVGIFIYR